MSIKINSRTPEEIKKGLECCMFDSEGLCNCDECPYVDDGCIYEMLNKDAIAYIRQLERERDAAVEQLKAVDVSSYFECAHCKHEELCDLPVWPCNDCDNEECPCHTCSDGSNWQWRGVQEVE